MTYKKNPYNYKMMYNMLGTQLYNNADWTNLWGVKRGGVRENFFVAYALEGDVDSATGGRLGLPVRHNLCNSPVEQPSPLNAEYTINCNKNHVGVS